MAREAREIAIRIIEKLGLVGLLAVEIFATRDGKLLVNELAPRPHNSGHHTIEACVTSQYEQHLRAILHLPLGSTRLRSAAVLVNLLGAPGYTGDARRSEAHTSELQSLMRISYAVFCLKQNKIKH